MTFVDNRKPGVIRLWPDGAPGSEHWTHREQETPPLPPFNVRVVRNVTQPSLSVYLPDPALATGTGVVVCPDGGFQTLYQAWWSAGHSAELHICAEGSHGFGMRKQGLPSDTWIDRFGDWLGVQGLLEPQRAAAAQSGASAR